MKTSSMIVTVLALAAAAIAQDSSNGPTPQNEPSSPPPAIVGQRAASRPSLDALGPNYMMGGISVTQMYTDNVEMTTTNPASDLSYEIQPRLTLSHSAPRLSYDLSVLAGFLVNRDLPERNQARQSAALDVRYGLAQFVNLRLSDQFTNSTGLWSGTNNVASSSGVGIGPVQQANSSLFTFGKFRTNTALADLSAQLSATAYTGVRASHTYLWYPDRTVDPVAGNLYGGQSYSAEVFYNHQFTQRNWGGITGRVQRFDLDQSEGRTDTTSVLLFYAFTVKPRTTLSLFGGPEFSITSAPAAVSLPATFSRWMWSPAAGAAFDWQGVRTAASVAFTRQINNSGGLASAVTLSSIEAQLTRQVGRRFTVGPSFGFTENVPIVSIPTMRTYSGRVQGSYRIGTYSFGGGYGRDTRTAVGSDLSGSANRVWVSFAYDFLRPLGQ